MSEAFFEQLESRMDAPAKIVCAILDDVNDRGGWRGQWDSFDPETQQEIAETWLTIIKAWLAVAPPQLLGGK